VKSAHPPFYQPPSSTRLGSADWARVRKRLILPRRIRPHRLGGGEGPQISRNGLAMLFQLW
jgi:hypothetical protein